MKIGPGKVIFTKEEIEVIKPRAAELGFRIEFVLKMEAARILGLPALEPKDDDWLDGRTPATFK